MANKKTIIGKTAPVPLGQQKAVNSLPVVFAEDQPPIPVEEQNKIQSEVALSLLGIPRAEVALGIFADVNTYDINPSEWSQFPAENDDDPVKGLTGLNHIAEEAGAQLVAAEGETTILTSKRFFRYQPGRVSSSTMGVKMNLTENPNSEFNTPHLTTYRDVMKGAPSIKKWGIFDKFDGYYFEVVNGGVDNDFRCVRRTQALVPYEQPGLEYTSGGWAKVLEESSKEKTNMLSGNWGIVGEDPIIYRNGLAYVAAAIYDPSLCYDPSDVAAINAGADLGDFDYDSGYAVRLAYRDGTGAFIEHMKDRHYQFPFDQRSDVTVGSAEYNSWKQDGYFLTPNSGGYIRLDAHCRWEDILTNLSRGHGTDFTGQLVVNGTSSVAKTAGGVAITPNDPRFGFDTAPSHLDSSSKVWNLLVSIQGYDGIISNSKYQAVFGSLTAKRTTAYDTANTTPGNRNVTLKEWFHLCVPEQYRMVYEWRPVRAMFSGDQLNGKSGNTVRWSDVSTANVDPSILGVKRPGDPILLDGAKLTSNSEYDIDFSKVTMWKIEFSWYGAVGALFLCYVPVANGEARWVRVHHMRASNQLDVASLGNATLPITYLVHGGKNSGLPASVNNSLVKYGASYYIDGGDKGTVRLLSKSTNYPKSIKYGTITGTVATASGNALTFNGGLPPNALLDQLIGSYLKSDTTTQVIWADTNGSNPRLYFNRAVGGLTGDIDIIVPRLQRAMIALRAKDNVINTSGDSIRNRIQLYPIKYGLGLTDKNTSESNLVSINFIKNPLLITNNLNNSGSGIASALTIGTDSYSNTAGFEIGAGTVPVKITGVSGWTLTGIDSYLDDPGKYFYAYMRSALISQIQDFNNTTPGDVEKPLLLRFFNKGGDIYVQNYESQTDSVKVYGNVMPVKMYEFSDEGDITLFTGSAITHDKFENQKKWDDPQTGTWESIAALSGAKVSQDFKLSPVANTGNNVFSIYDNKGGSEYSLTDYFAYNKEYISFPLTNEVDIIGGYAFWESTSSSTPSQLLPIDIVNCLTWEEQ
jgi:hypothetical protein